ncbi:MAG: hypothetical protein LBJ76_01390 [Candidatus Accumulibacter sp.]|jgi:hypothetical protein|nr:hypothetical protein [Accumulibacter sp.]
MSIDLTKAMNYSWMSQAAYLDITSVIPGSADSLANYLKRISINPGNIFAEKQADHFTDASTGFSFIDQLPNTAYGTSITVFESNADGSYTLAVRGTEPSAQWGADLLHDIIGVFGAGKAKAQVFEAFRYYKRLTTAEGQSVVYTEAEIDAMAHLLQSDPSLAGSFGNLAAAATCFMTLTADDEGLGLIPDGSVINFAGHSLGGHVAYLLAQLINATDGGIHTIGDVMTYNAPGENALFYEIQNWFGIDTSSPAGLIGSKHLAFYAEAGLNVTAGLGQVIGTRVPLFIEDEGAVSGNILMENHSIVKLSDALALYETFAILSPSLTLGEIEEIFEKANASDLDSLETALDALRTLLLDGDIATNTSKQTPTGNRDTFYTHLYALQESDAYGDIKGEVTLSGNVMSLVSSALTGAQNLPAEIFIPTERNSQIGFRNSRHLSGCPPARV